jgi:hypothetical protein
MSGRSPFEVQLSPEDSAVLEERMSSRTTAPAEVPRACIVLLAAHGGQNVDIAQRVEASMWRRNGARAFARRGPRGLRVRPRSGRPRRVGAAVVAGIKAANHPSDVTFRHGGARSSWPPRRDAKGRARRIDFVLDGAPLVVGGGNQVMALPVLDLPARLRLRSKSDVRPRPPLALLRRRGTPPERLRDLGQREVLAPGAQALPPQPRSRSKGHPVGRVRVRGPNAPESARRCSKPPRPSSKRSLQRHGASAALFVAKSRSRFVSAKSSITTR